MNKQFRVTGVCPDCNKKVVEGVRTVDYDYLSINAYCCDEISIISGTKKEVIKIIDSLKKDWKIKFGTWKTKAQVRRIC